MWEIVDLQNIKIENDYVNNMCILVCERNCHEEVQRSTANQSAYLNWLGINVNFIHVMENTLNSIKQILPVLHEYDHESNQFHNELLNIIRSGN